MTPTSPHAKNGLSIGTTLGGDAFAQVLSELDSLDLDLSDLLAESIGRIFGRKHLSLADREMCVVAILAVQANLGQLKWHLNASLNVGMPALALKEVLIQTIPYSGWPVGLNSLAVLKEVADSRGLSLKSKGHNVDSSSFHADGVKHAKAIYPDFDAAIAQLASFDAALPDLVIETSFSSIYSRPDLDMRHREMVAVAMLGALQRLPQLKSHLIGAHRVGCSHDETKEILVTLIGYSGWPACLNSLSVWKEVTTAS